MTTEAREAGRSAPPRTLSLRLQHLFVRLGVLPFLLIIAIIVTGVDATNRALLQVMSNVFGVDVYRLDVANAAALGAALRAYQADRLDSVEPVSWSTVVSGFTEPNPGHRVSPNPKLVAMYAELRREYAALEPEPTTPR